MTYQDLDQFVTALASSDVADEALHRSLVSEFDVKLETAKMSLQEGEAREPTATLRIPIPKAKSYLEIEPDKVPLHVYEAALVKGFQQLLGKGMTKFTKELYPDADELAEVAFKKAQENLEDVYAGRVTIRGAAKADKVPREVQTEARRIARSLVKDQLKKAGVKISYVESSEITKAANALLAADPAITEQAREEVEKRAKQKVSIDIAGMVPISAKKKAAAEAKKGAKVLSAAQAGKVATRGRPSPNA